MDLLSYINLMFNFKSLDIIILCWQGAVQGKAKGKAKATCPPPRPLQQKNIHVYKNTHTKNNDSIKFRMIISTNEEFLKSELDNCISFKLLLSLIFLLKHNRSGGVGELQ